MTNFYRKVSELFFRTDFPEHAAVFSVAFSYVRFFYRTKKGALSHLPVPHAPGHACMLPGLLHLWILSDLELLVLLVREGNHERLFSHCLVVWAHPANDPTGSVTTSVRNLAPDTHKTKKMQPTMKTARRANSRINRILETRTKNASFLVCLKFFHPDSKRFHEQTSGSLEPFIHSSIYNLVENSFIHIITYCLILVYEGEAI